MDLSAAVAQLDSVRREIGKIIVGQTAVVDGVLTCLFAGGHVLLEGVPGLGKTTLLRTLSRVLHLKYSRIQFTPDLMPADIVGGMIIESDATGLKALRFQPGPIFANLILADEINRATPKTQSALLEAMQERTVTSGTTTHELELPFLVMATQNPIEMEGTYPLPEAQLDRFLLHVVVEMPDEASERRILDLVEGEMNEEAAPMPLRLTAEDLRAARAAALRTYVSPALKDYLVRLVAGTRNDTTAPDLRAAIEHPVSPRGTLALMLAGKARAYLHGRDHVVPEDVTALAADALSHRLAVTWRAAAEGRTARHLVAGLLERVRPL